MMKKEEFNQKEYINQWKKDNCKQYAFRFNKELDKKIIQHLDKQEDKTNYIRTLIEKDLKRCKK